MFAKHDIQMGDLILAERPLLVMPTHLWPLVEIPDDSNASQLQIIQASLMEWEKHLRLMLSRMEPGGRAAFMQLTNSHKDDGSGPILGISRTNGIAMTIGQVNYSVTTKLISCANHRYARHATC